MISYEIVTVSLYRTGSGWSLLVSWRSSVDNASPQWTGFRVPGLQLSADNLVDLLESLGEELFNQAQTAEQAAVVRDALPAPSGDSDTRPLF